MRSCHWLTIALALPLFGQDQPAARPVNFYSLEKEAALGAHLAGEVSQRTKSLDSPAVLVYVNRLGQRLAARFPPPAITFTFAVITGNSAGATHEPISLPGGYIFVPAPLFLAAQDEAEFAGMLAHAMAHVAARHYTREATRGGRITSPVVPLIFMGGWEGFGMNQGQNLAIPAGFLKFQRQTELEADRLAARAMSEAGFDPAALARYIGRVQPSEDRLRTPSLSLLPGRDERVAALSQAIQDLPSAVYSAGDDFQPIQDAVSRHIPAPPPPPTLRRSGGGQPRLR
jgi:predicted Zn-dependent protease